MREGAGYCVFTVGEVEDMLEVRERLDDVE
jgi:hypothetical protein